MKIEQTDRQREDEIQKSLTNGEEECYDGWVGRGRDCQR